MSIIDLLEAPHEAYSTSSTAGAVADLLPLIRASGSVQACTILAEMDARLHPDPLLGPLLSWWRFVTSGTPLRVRAPWLSPGLRVQLSRGTLAQMRLAACVPPNIDGFAWLRERHAIERARAAAGTRGAASGAETISLPGADHRLYGETVPPAVRRCALELLADLPEGRATPLNEVERRLAARLATDAPDRDTRPVWQRLVHLGYALQRPAGRIVIGPHARAAGPGDWDWGAGGG